jgi:hypothetical protein
MKSAATMIDETCKSFNARKTQSAGKDIYSLTHAKFE